MSLRTWEEAARAAWESSLITRVGGHQGDYRHYVRRAYTLHESRVRCQGGGGQKCGLLPVLAAELPPGLGLRACSVDILHPGLQRDVLRAG